MNDVLVRTVWARGPVQNFYRWDFASGRPLSPTGFIETIETVRRIRRIEVQIKREALTPDLTAFQVLVDSGSMSFIDGFFDDSLGPEIGYIDCDMSGSPFPNRRHGIYAKLIVWNPGRYTGDPPPKWFGTKFSVRADLKITLE